VAIEANPEYGRHQVIDCDQLDQVGFEPLSNFKRDENY
jgi:hypothetical protein